MEIGFDICFVRQNCFLKPAGLKIQKAIQKIKGRIPRKLHGGN